MSENKLQKKMPESIKEKGQYFIAFGVIGSMLLVAGFPTFVVFFFGIFAYFLWKTFSSPSRSETREIFEFYLSANDVLRDDERRWYGFELQEIANRGERIVQMMNVAPPLVYFTLGALYHKMGDHNSAVNNLSYLVENESADESTYVYPTPELRNYVKILRKIEREPAEAPLTSAAIRALERSRRNRSKAILEESRNILQEQTLQKQAEKLEKKKLKGEFSPNSQDSAFMQSVAVDSVEPLSNSETLQSVSAEKRTENNAKSQKIEKKKEEENPFSNRKPISEVLHDIYDRNIQ